MNIATTENAKFHYALNRPIYLALLDSRMNEITGESYHRTPITFSADEQDPKTAKNCAVEFPPSSGDWGEICNFAITLSAVAKNGVLEFSDVLFAGVFFNTARPNEGDRVSIAESMILIRYDE